jgi:hypothetical protein
MNTRVHTSIDKSDDGKGQCWCNKNDHVGVGYQGARITAEILGDDIPVYSEAVSCARNIMCFG